MGFLSGRISFERFRIVSPEPAAFGPETLETLQRFAIDQVQTISLDEPAVGFVAGRHLLDLDFSLEKNILGDVLHCGVRIDVHKIPSSLKKAWLAIELQALGFDNPSGRPSKAQRKEAEEAIQARCEGEAADGRFRRMQEVPILWDAGQGVLYIGAASPAAREQCLGLLERAFDLSLERITAGRLAQDWASHAKKMAVLEKVFPSAFQPSQVDAQVAWISGTSQNLDYLGNEFLLWLWWTLETQSDTIELTDGSELVAMLTRTLSLECPLAQSGKETISSESPVRLPEAMLAISSGKLPRKSGLILVRDGVQYDFVLQAETLAVSGAKVQIATSGNAAASGTDDDRIETVRNLTESIDLLFQSFCQRRLGKAWNAELEQIRGWLSSIAPKKSAA